MNAAQVDPFEVVYEDINNFLLDYGWMVGPSILGGEFDRLKRYCDKTRKSPPTDATSRLHVERELNAMMLNITFHPNYRAAYVYRAKRTIHLVDFSHFIERAVLHYYKGDYLSCALCLLPAAEGVLRSHYAASPSASQDTSFKRLSEFLSASPGQNPNNQRRDMYGRILSRFLSRWLYSKTQSADFAFSYLNRHYVLHGLGVESFYRAADCHRLFLFFDIYTDLLGEESGQHDGPFLPHGPDIDIRVKLYRQLLSSKEMALSQVHEQESLLMQEHPNFKCETDPPSIRRSFEEFAKGMLGLGLALINKDQDKK